MVTKLKRTFTVLMLILGVAILLMIAKREGESDAVLQVIVERLDESILDVQGNVVAEVYYDKPMLIGNSEVAKKINEFLEEEYKEFQNGSSHFLGFSRERKEHFLNDVSEMINAQGTQTLIEAPFSYTVDTQIVLFDEQYLSLLQIAFLQTAGPSWTVYSGRTFNLTTGELLPINDIVAVDADTVRNVIIQTCLEHTTIFDTNEQREHIREVYGNENSYSTITMNRQYYYDGQYVYLILNDVGSGSGGYILKWNGIYGERKETKLFSYWISSRHTIEKIYYED